jgi:hypothetical protein
MPVIVHIMQMNTHFTISSNFPGCFVTYSICKWQAMDYYIHGHTMGYYINGYTMGYYINGHTMGYYIHGYTMGYYTNGHTMGY